MTEITPEQLSFYERQAREYAARAVDYAAANNRSPAAEPPLSVQPKNANEGTLRVQVFSANGIFPVPDAAVSVADDSGVLYRRTTDRSGIVTGITLPAFAAGLSQSEETAEGGMVYTVAVLHPDYTPVERKIEIYAGIESVLPVNLVPAMGEGT